MQAGLFGINDPCFFLEIAKIDDVVDVLKSVHFAPRNGHLYDYGIIFQ